ncbi:hypothetical protein [Thiosulfativibrio zosterae]|uniref:Uncharacterized protein n=1 Tax=Thiosulfativibrio zosterae TaxID=2675053 RepID=A0A6F8PQW2_9GAMM|nr:hypothetical protein [Thiosulfativibrio zosterae]BBP44511.1 hypothetical protein THMIRHAT_22570 [Thiosulfativibrio zosterae]
MNTIDYGLKLLAEGASRTQDIFFSEVPFLEYAKLNSNTYTFVATHETQNDEYLSSFDFSKQLLQIILAKIKAEKSLLTNQSGLPYTIYLNLRVRLGKEQHDLTGEPFIPFVIQEILE